MWNKVLKIFLRRVAVFGFLVLLAVAIVYGLNFLLWNYAFPKTYLANISLSQDSALFMEGLLLVVAGVLLLLGQGGISYWSLKAALLGSAAESVYGRKGQGAPGASEIFQEMHGNRLDLSGLG